MSKLIEGAKDALAVARGEKHAAVLHHNGHAYVPKAEADALLTTLDEARAEAVKALIKARNGLSDGVNQYAIRDFGGAIIPGDEQYPWVRSMQIGLDAVHQALEVKP